MHAVTLGRRWFADLSIARKLYAMAGVLLALMIIVGLLGVSSLSSSAGLGRAMYQDATIPIEHLDGVGLALDDFGTGYSSLTHLRTLPVGQVKLDRSFVSRMCVDAADAAIVYATIELARMLGLRTVAEGVEDEATWGTLVGMGCDRIQGYALGRPMPPPDFEQLLTRIEQALAAGALAGLAA